jgi:hypothetical protein
VEGALLLRQGTQVARRCTSCSTRGREEITSVPSTSTRNWTSSDSLTLPNSGLQNHGQTKKNTHWIPSSVAAFANFLQPIGNPPCKSSIVTIPSGNQVGLAVEHGKGREGKRKGTNRQGKQEREKLLDSTRKTTTRDRWEFVNFAILDRRSLPRLDVAVCCLLYHAAHCACMLRIEPDSCLVVVRIGIEDRIPLHMQSVKQA